MNNLACKYKHGFSATPKRTDSLTDVIFFAAGPLVKIVRPDEVGALLVKPSYTQIKTDYYFPLFDSSEYQEMITDLSEDEDRNKLIIDAVKDYKKGQIVILCNRLSQVNLLHKKIKGSEILTSKMTKKARKKVIANLENKKTRIIISTYSLFSTGIDLKGLEILFLAAPVKSEITLTQARGRILRSANYLKSPKIIDFIDHRVSLLKNQSDTRRSLFKKLEGE